MTCGTASAGTCVPGGQGCIMLVQGPAWVTLPVGCTAGMSPLLPLQGTAHHSLWLPKLSPCRSPPPVPLLCLSAHSAPLMGAFINLNASSVANFTIHTPDGYIYPKGLASCMTGLQGRPMYVETGGTEFDVERNEDVLSKGVFVMEATVSAAQHSLVAAAGGAGVAPGFVHSALACTPDGQLFLFGGLRNGGRRGLNPGGDAATSWEPTNSLTALRLSGSAGSPSVSQQFEVSSGATSPQPAARSGQAMAHLPPSVVSSLGLSQGGLVMYGGSNIPATLQDYLLGANATAAAAKLRGTQWDTTTWLFDVAGRKWVQLATQGAGPPGLMYHSMTAAGQQVR